MNWKEVDERLRGELIFDLDFVDRYEKEPKEMNRGKEGSPFKLTNSYILFLAIVRYLFSLPYRQLEGFTIGLSKLVPKLRSADYPGIRKRMMKMDVDISRYSKFKGSNSISIAVDSTGVKVHKSGGWIERKGEEGLW